MPALVALAATAGAPDGAALVPLAQLGSHPGGAASALRRGTHGGQSLFLTTQEDSDGEDAISAALALASAGALPRQPAPAAPPSAEAVAALAGVAALRATGNASFAAGRHDDAVEAYQQARGVAVARTLRTRGAC
jgi:hypothetical protein